MPNHCLSDGFFLFCFFTHFIISVTYTTVTVINLPTVEATELNKRGQTPRKGFRLCLTQYIQKINIMIAHMKLQLPK